jgi:hypothetical protein
MGGGAHNRSRRKGGGGERSGGDGRSSPLKGGTAGSRRGRGAAKRVHVVGGGLGGPGVVVGRRLSAGNDPTPAGTSGVRRACSRR